MPYSGNPGGSTVDAVRFWLQDTAARSSLLSDEEIRYFITYAQGYTADPLLLAAGLCTVLMAKYAGEVSIAGDGITYSGEQLQDKYRQLQSSLRAQWQLLNGNRGFPYAGGTQYFDWVNRMGSKPGLFAIGMNDNPRGAGQLVSRHPGEMLEAADDYYGTGSYYEGG